MTIAAGAPAPLYLQIKRLITEKVLSGQWSREERIPSENELVRELGVSRMTVHRALRELTDEGFLLRLQGVGTFVAPSKPQSSLLEIRNIADDIAARGHRHSCSVEMLRRESADAAVAATLGLAPGAPVYRSVCVHRENDVPLQYEDRYVNPAVAPNYLEQDFTRTVPTAYLSSLVPAIEAEHVVEAVRPTAEMQRLLRIPADEPCLMLTRTTWSGGMAVTHAHLVHPGSRYRLASRFSPAQRER